MLRGKLKYLEKQLPLKSALTQRDSEEENSKLSDIGRAKKNLKHTTSTSSMADQCHVFNDALDNPDCRCILTNCLKIIDKAVRKKNKIW